MSRTPTHARRSRAARSAIAAAMAASSLAAGAAWADPSPALDRMSFSAGAFYADPSINVNGDTRYGHLDSGDVGTSHVTLPRVKANLLIGDSQGLDFDYYRYDKSYNPTVSGSTTVGGTPVSGSATVDGNLRLDLAQLAYKWWIGSGNDVFGVGVGAAYYQASLKGTASGVLNGVAGSGTYDEKESAWAPLLELGWRHSISENVRVYADASGIKKNGGSIQGHIYGGAIGVEWFPAKMVGVVAEYTASKISLNRPSNSTDLNIRLNGPAAYVKVRF